MTQEIFSRKSPMGLAILGGAALALTVFAAPAQAGLVLENDLIFCTGSNKAPGPGQSPGGPCYGFADEYNLTPSDSDDFAAEQNSLLPQFPNGVDLIGTWDFDDEAFTSAFTDLHPDGDPFFSDGAIEMSFDIDAGLWSWELLERTAIWDVVKIGIKQSNVKAYFLVEPGADSGTFSMLDLYSDNPELLDGWFNGSATNVFSHVSFFGTTTQDIPEPAALALLGLGLVGLGFARRRKAA